MKTVLFLLFFCYGQSASTGDTEEPFLASTGIFLGPTTSESTVPPVTSLAPDVDAVTEVTTKEPLPDLEIKADEPKMYSLSNLSNAVSPPVSTSDGNDNSTDAVVTNIFQTYLPLVTLLATLPDNDTATIRSQSLVPLKKSMHDLERHAHSDALNDSMLLILDDAKVANIVGLLEDYHNARIYAVSRTLWQARISGDLAELDQNAILDYIEEKRRRDEANKDFFSRIWMAIKKLFVHDKPADEQCTAREPRCIRAILDALPVETKDLLDDATEMGDEKRVVSIIQSFSHSNETLEEFHSWQRNATLPVPLVHIIYNATVPQQIALQRLRDKQLVSSLKDYYRTLIERKSHEEQEEIRSYFKRMNATFAGCFNPARSRNYEYWRYDL